MLYNPSDHTIACCPDNTGVRTHPVLICSRTGESHPGDRVNVILGYVV